MTGQMPRSPKRPPTMKEVIIRTSAMTLFVAILTLAYGLTVFGWMFPRVMVDFSVSIGAHNAAGMYSERVYNRDKTPENLYLTLDRYIKAGNHKKVTSVGTKFFNLEPEDYKRVINEVNAHWEAEAAGNKLKLLQWGNEDNRIKSAYIRALLREGKKDIAASKFDEQLFNARYNTPDLLQPNHSYFAFVERGIDTVNDIIILTTGNTPTNANEIFKDYVEKFAMEYDKETFEGEKVFALHFLMRAYDYMGNATNRLYYARLFNDYVSQ